MKETKGKEKASSPYLSGLGNREKSGLDDYFVSRGEIIIITFI